MRDAIVFSGWSWETFNVPERITLALAYLGSKVLYCENPSSILRRKKQSELKQIQDRIFVFRPVFGGHRFNRIPLFREIQAHIVARQIVQHAKMLGLNKPLFFYPWMSNFLSLCLEMKAKGFFLVHIHMDYLENNSEAHVDISDITLVIQRCTFHKLRARFGDKVHLIPQSVNFKLFHSQMSNFKEQQGDSLSIPRPRLGYTGPIHNRLNLSMLSELLLRHPNWHFVSFGSREKIFRFPNFHVIPWKRQEELPKIFC